MARRIKGAAPAAPAAVGSRWRHVTGNVYEYLGQVELEDEPTYNHALRLAERSGRDMTPLNHVMHVELAWFVHAARPA
jgi:hypothetical protein